MIFRDALHFKTTLYFFQRKNTSDQKWTNFEQMGLNCNLWRFLGLYFFEKLGLKWKLRYFKLFLIACHY